MTGPTLHLRDQHGHTLVEMIVAILILGAILAATLPRMGESARLHRLRSAAEELHSSLVKARSTAVTKGATVRLDINAAAGTVIVREDEDNDGVFDISFPPRNLPAGIQVARADFGGLTSVIFNGRGVPSSGGTVVFTLPNGEMREVRVAPGSGAASIVNPDQSEGY